MAECDLEIFLAICLQKPSETLLFDCSLLRVFQVASCYDPQPTTAAPARPGDLSRKGAITNSAQGQTISRPHGRAASPGRIHEPGHGHMKFGQVPPFCRHQNPDDPLISFDSSTVGRRSSQPGFDQGSKHPPGSSATNADPLQRSPGSTTTTSGGGTAKPVQHGATSTDKRSLGQTTTNPSFTNDSASKRQYHQKRESFPERPRIGHTLSAGSAASKLSIDTHGYQGHRNTYHPDNGRPAERWSRTPFPQNTNNMNSNSWRRRPRAFGGLAGFRSNPGPSTNRGPSYYPRHTSKHGFRRRTWSDRGRGRGRNAVQGQGWGYGGSTSGSRGNRWVQHSCIKGG